MPNKPEWLNVQSGVIPIIDHHEGIKVVLVTTKEKTGWIFPKGEIELGMTPQNSAAKEALEEAGVKGDVGHILIDEYTYEKWGGELKVKVFTLSVTTVLDTWDEMTERERKIVGLDEAINLVKSVQKGSLQKLKSHLEKQKSISSVKVH